MSNSVAVDYGVDNVGICSYFTALDVYFFEKVVADSEGVTGTVLCGKADTKVTQLKPCVYRNCG